MKSLILLILCFSTIFVHAQIPDFDWAKVTKLGNFQGARDMVIDSDGNSYTTGYFRGNTDFDPGPGTLMLNGGIGGTDIFVLKLSAAGNFVWAKRFSGSSASSDLGKSITIDSLANIYISGEFEGTVDFDPGPGIFNLTSTGAQDVFIVKLTSSGNLVWAKSFGGISAELVFDIKINNPNTLMLMGFYHDTVDFDPGPGVYNLISAGYQDGYLCKLNANGDFQWAKSYGGSAGTDQISSADFDSDDNIYIGGYFIGTVDLDPGPDTLNYTPVSSWQDLFVQKLDSSGNEIWTSVFHGQGSEGIATIKYDPLGYVYCSGSTNSPVDFDPGPGVVMEPITPTGFFTGFLVKLSDTLGNLVWVDIIKGQDNQSARDFDIDTLGNIYLTGSLDGTADFDPGPGIYNLTSKGAGIFPYVCDDAFITKLTPAGELIWAYAYGGVDQDEVFSIHLGDSGYIYTCGLYSKLVDFDPGAAVHTQNGVPMAAYVYRINECFPGESTATHIACGSFTWINGVTYTSSNHTATYALADAAANGCDSIIHLNLTILPNSYYTDVAAACSSYTWINGVTYTSSTNNATYILPNSIGCDSIITLNLTIYPSHTTTLNVSACNSYLWPTNGTTYTTNGTYSHLLTSSHGCDSLVVLNLTIGAPNSGSESRTECDHYTWPANGVDYTNSGTYTAVTQNSSGCDSTVTLNLTIIHSTSSSENAVACDAYTWPINGQTYTTSGVHTATIPNAVGCDSVITLNLTINHSNLITENIIACDQYYWPVNNTTYTSSGTYIEQFSNQSGCDSIRTLHLNVNYSSSSITVMEACGSYTWTNGSTYITSGSYTQTLLTSSGCDSIATLDLTVDPVPGITFNGFTLAATTTGNSYQWLNCAADFSPILGETSSSLTLTANGSYAVVVATDNCIDTSVCFVVEGLQVSEIFPENAIQVIPNPTNGKIFVSLIQLAKQVDVQLIDLNGKILQQTMFSQTDTFEWMLVQVPGIYVLKINTDGYQSRVKLIVN